MTCIESDFTMDEESDFEEDDVFDMSDDEENVAPPQKASKPASKASQKKATNVLSPNKNIGNVAGKSAGGKGKKKTVEETYQKKTQLEHILLRPDTYIGSVEPITQTMFVLDPITDRLVNREITFTPGLYKIFDEILVNAADNKQRDPSMDKLDIAVDQDSNLISVKNNGKGIPVVMHKEHNCYVPTLIFGHLLTGSNFDDDEKKTTGGRNGYGAKLANIFSTMFLVECVDSKAGLKFTQIFRDNMGKTEEPTIKQCTASEKKAGDYTKISFSPDLKRFKMASLNDDTVNLLSKRAYDIAGSMAARPGKKLKVTLNGKLLPVKSFADYLKLLDGINSPVAYEKFSERWEVGVAVSDGSAQQVSFVNAICTSKGGGHVAYIADQIGSHLVKTIKKKNKGGTDVKPNQIKNHLCVFVNCLIENPTFDSQTKDNLTSRPKQFGSACKLSDAFLKKIEKGDIVESVLAYAKFKQDRELKRKGGVKKSKLTGIPKLEDANHAGTAKSTECTLILTEGDSAKSLAMSGLSVVGRDFYGVFPLKGKPLNVRDASHAAVMKNAEVQYICQILGLKMGEKYDSDSIKKLRYGHLMIMADQDHDGSHIKGLVINMIHRFLQQFITPIVKATKGKQSKTFFTLPEYESWKESTGNDGKGWKIKYYKGLGTSTSAEAKEYFSKLDLHELSFCEITLDQTSPRNQEHGNEADIMEVDNDISDVSPDDVQSGSDLIDMVFNKNRVDERKKWLNTLEKNTFLDYSQDEVKYSDFINKELILFSKSDNERSIPHIMDGFKPSQRKVLFGCFKRKLKDEIKVAQLAGYIGEHSAYHHGEMSLHGTIINMAQSFCGSNNINLLTPSGQFGTRRMGGKDAASPRYIFTKLEKITRTIFHPDDDELLTYLNEDGLSIEPEHYMPVIPMVLVNGSDGIGTGWSSSIPNYDPRLIVNNIRHMLQGEPIDRMLPFYSGFTGEIIPDCKEGKFIVRGKIERVDATTLHISELPIRKWTQDYKTFLEGMLTGDSKKDETPQIKDFKENHTDTTVSFTITAEEKKIDEFQAKNDGLLGKFKLSGSINTTNMTLFDKDYRIMKFATPEDILREFFALRMEFYVKRKALLVEKMRKEQKMLSNKARFVEEVCSGDLIVSNRKKKELLLDLQERGYDLFDKNDSKGESDTEEEDEGESPSDAELAKGYEYLLGMKIWSLTFEKAEELRSQLAAKTAELEVLEGTSPSQIWLRDLDAIENAMDERDRDIEEALDEEKKAQTKSQKRQANMKKKAAKKKKASKKKSDEWDSDMEDSDDDVGSDSEVEVVVKKNASRRRNPPKNAAKRPADKPTIKNTVKVEEKIDDVELGLTERIQKRMVISSTSIKTDGNDGSESFETGRGTKRPSPKASESDDDEVCNSTAQGKKAVSRKAAPKKAPAKRARAAATAKKPARATTRKGKSKVADSDSEDEFDFDKEEIAAPSATARRPTRGAQNKKSPPTYTFDDSETDSDSDFS